MKSARLKGGGLNLTMEIKLLVFVQPLRWVFPTNRANPRGFVA